jgi:hypothetical protein
MSAARDHLLFQAAMPAEGTRTTPELTCDGRVTTARLDGFRRLALDSALAEIVRLSGTAGVRPLLLKGPAFAHWLYDDPRERSYNDIDLLVGPDEFDAARRVLAALGFESLPRNGLRPNERPDSYHEEWIRPGTLPLAVELHHTLWGATAAPTVVWERMTNGARAIEVAGAHVETPSEVGSAMIVAVHAADHARVARRPTAQRSTHQRRQGRRVNLNPGGRFAGRDLQLALERVDIETWRAAAMLAEELGAGALFAFGLRLDSSGRTIANRLGLTARVPRQLAAGRPPTAAGIELFMTTPGVGARVRLLAREVAPSRAFMLKWSPIARRGRLGLTCAYLWRPVWLMMMLPRGVRVWLRASQ